jgi:hypothetical protein
VTDTDLEVHCYEPGFALRVAFTTKVTKVFVGLDAKVRAPLKRWLEIMAKEGTGNIPRDVLKFERRFICGRRRVNIAVFALRQWQTRMYGGIVPGMNPPTFLFTEIDDSKKQNKADPTALERSAERIAEHCPNS